MKDNLRYLEQAKKGRPLLLDTKVCCPLVSQNMINRMRLLKKLDEGLSRKITIVVAAAGYGKSVLLADWINANNLAAAWLTLEAEDNDIVRFWSYFFHAIENIQFHPGKKAAEYLYTSGPFHIDKVLTIFINELNREEETLVMVLDDFHVIDDPAIYRALKYLFDHMPHNFHIYIAGRSAPSMQLSGLRVKDEMLEILTEDLRFTFEETQRFFKMRSKYIMSRRELLKVHSSMEGWAAGLQLFSMLQKSFSDKRRLLEDLLGDQSLIMDYFSEEILSQQADKIKKFLLRTSILQKMNGSLCNALTGDHDGHEVLELLKEHNLFIYSLDAKNKWYRYHHLFAEALRAIAIKKEPALIKELHQKAYKWLKEKGLLSEAINHAFKAGDFDAAAEWIELEAPRLFRAGELTTLLSLISSLPKSIFYQRPRIWLYYIWALNITGSFEKAKSSCEELFALTRDKGKMSGIKGNLSRRFLESEVEFIKCGVSFYQGKSSVIEDYKKALNNIQRGGLLAEGMIRFNAGSASLLQGSQGLFGRIRFADLFFSSTESAIEKVCKDFPSFAVGYAMVSEIRYEQNNLNAAEKYGRESLRILKKNIDWGVVIPAYIVLANVEMARGRFSNALDLWRNIENSLQESGLYQWMSICNAYKARVSIKKDDHEAVAAWAASGEFSAKDEINILQYYQFATLVRVLLYLDNPRDALMLTEQIMQSLEESGGIGQIIEICLLQALCCRELNLLDRALLTLEQAAEMGLQEGYCRIFVDEEEKILGLLQLLIVQHQHHLGARCNGLNQYINQICSLIVAESLKGDSKQIYQMVSSLTKREREVLRLVSEGCTNREITRELFISLPTVNTHLTNIFRKLNVNSRTKAVALLKENGYLA